MDQRWLESFGEQQLIYLAGDLGTTGLPLIILSLDQRKADREDQEEGQEKVAEIHGCELPQHEV